MTDISSLNNNSLFNELDTSLPLTIGNGITSLGGGNYVASPNGIGLATYDNWLGVLGAPAPSDIIGYTTTVSNAALDVIQYSFTTADGSVSPKTGGIGAEVVAWNSTGVLVEQLTGYVPGQTSLSPDGTYLIFALPRVDLSVTDGSAGPTTAELTFGTSGAFPGFPVPEPSTAVLMPLMVILLMVSRIRAVRSFLAGR